MGGERSPPFASTVISKAECESEGRGLQPSMRVTHQQSDAPSRGNAQPDHEGRANQAS